MAWEKGFDSQIYRRPRKSPWTIRLDYECSILDSQPAATRCKCSVFGSERSRDMTYLDVLFRYATPPSERAMRAMDAVREVYGIRRIEFNETERTVRVEFDASRLSDDVVAKLLKQTGLDVREKLALA